jgi:Lactate racemase N-terminal domain
MAFPEMIRIRQSFQSAALEDIPGEIASRFSALGDLRGVRKGQTVAVACSSRGIANYGTIAGSVVSCLKGLGLKPFIIPAMGSHGGATAGGQERVLQHLGVTEAYVGAPVRSSLEVVQLGETEEGIPVHVDKLAAAADHIVLINRIKKHTEFEHWFESGLLKMMAIGLGKQQGAALYHQAMLTHGYPKVILSVARSVLASGKILFGVGVVEDGYSQTAKIGICGPGHMEDMERDLFKAAKGFSPGLPFEEADILIVDEMGKEISGTGFDTKVVGRIGLPLVTKEPESPRVKRILVCDLTAGSEGNAVGVGIADFITRRLFDKIDMDALNMNTITGVCPEMGKIPPVLENDREAIDVAIKCVGLIPQGDLKIMRIKNTLRVDEIDLSEGYERALKKRPELEVMMKKRPMAFDGSGNLEPFFS